MHMQVGNEATVLGFVGLPYTLATYLVEGKSSKVGAPHHSKSESESGEQKQKQKQLLYVKTHGLTLPRVTLAGLAFRRLRKG
jgi:uroporphyrinogen-III decarboxylase